jgi:hypothetical protein
MNRKIGIVSCIILLGTLCSCAYGQEKDLEVELAGLSKSEGLGLAVASNRGLDVTYFDGPQMSHAAIPGLAAVYQIVASSGDILGYSGAVVLYSRAGLVQWRASPNIQAMLAQVAAANTTEFAIIGSEQNTGRIGLAYGRVGVDELQFIYQTSAADAYSPNATHETFGWSPDGGAIAWSRSGTVYIYDLKNHRSNRLAPGWNPAWSPDGKLIAYMTTRGEVAISDSRGDSHREPMPGRKVNGVLRWSPDSRYILFCERHFSLASISGCFSTTRLVVLRVADGATAPVYDPCMGQYNERYHWIKAAR